MRSDRRARPRHHRRFHEPDDLVSLPLPAVGVNRVVAGVSRSSRTGLESDCHGKHADCGHGKARQRPSSSAARARFPRQRGTDGGDVERRLGITGEKLDERGELGALDGYVATRRGRRSPRAWTMMVEAPRAALIHDRTDWTSTVSWHGDFVAPPAVDPDQPKVGQHVSDARRHERPAAPEQPLPGQRNFPEPVPQGSGEAHLAFTQSV